MFILAAIGCVVSYLNVGAAVACVDMALHPEIYPAHDDMIANAITTACIWPAVVLDWLVRI